MPVAHAEIMAMRKAGIVFGADDPKQGLPAESLTF